MEKNPEFRAVATATSDIHEILRKYWSYGTFRPMQEDIIRSVLSGRDTLALLPTGGGKSLCFQVPGLALGGTTLVISPLVALMNDQVQNLRRRGISAVAISAAMHYREIDVALTNAALGHVQFLYVSPERLTNEDFRQKISHLPVTLIAVDEAHCISQWGYDFRPSYLQIKEIRQYFPGVSIIALTASATREVVEDIQVQLDFREKNIFRQSFVRRNLRYVVQKEENKAARLIRIISRLGGSGLVYLRNRKRTEELSSWLRAQKISSAAYHAGLKYDERQTIQQDWIDNKTQVICATNAFGMGIDKPDVRFVVHLDLPDSLEAYFQEAGRAGRDGQISYSTILFSAADQQQLTENFKKNFPEIPYIRNVYKALCNYYQIANGAGEGVNIDLDIESICRSYNLSAPLVYNSIRFLEKENYFSILEAGIEPSKVMVTSGKERLYEFEMKYPKYEALIKTLLRSYGGLFENYVHISEKDLGYRIKNSAAVVTEYLAHLDAQGVLSYRPQSALPRLLFLRDRVEERYVEISHDHYQKLKDQQLARINSVIAYSDNDKICRQVQLLMYFNEFDFADCGHCDVCIARRNPDYQRIREVLSDKFENQSYTLEQLKSEMSAFRDEKWLQVFNEMLEDDVLFVNGTVYSKSR